MYYLQNPTSSEFLWSWKQCTVGSEWHGAVLPHHNRKRRKNLQASKLLGNVNSTMTNSGDYTAAILMKEWERRNRTVQ
jgi:hypothetical protein